MSNEATRTAARVHRVPFPGGTLRVVDEGDPTAPALVFGHGLLNDVSLFDGQAAALRSRYRVVRIDWRGHGESSPSPARYSMVDQARDYVRVMDFLAIERAVIVGLSMGAMAALHLALRYPQRVRALALLDTSAAREERIKRARYRMMVLALLLLGPVRPLVRSAAKILYGRTYRTEHPEAVEAAIDRACKLDRHGIARAVTMVLTRPSVESELGSINAPCLVLCGEEDTATPPAKSRALAAALPDARLVLIARAGHLSAEEAPAAVTAALETFIAAL